MSFKLILFTNFDIELQFVIIQNDALPGAFIASGVESAKSIQKKIMLRFAQI